jgi:hypothetical protein
MSFLKSPDSLTPCTYFACLFYVTLGVLYTAFLLHTTGHVERLIPKCAVNTSILRTSLTFKNRASYI